MKKISNICGFIGIAIYAVLMIRISNLCQYGGTKVDLIPILILGVVLIATIIFGIVSSRKEEKIEKGLTLKELSDAISKATGIEKNRANLIAADQVGNVYAQATKAQFKGIGLKKFKWVTARDKRVRPSHQDREGKIYSWDNPPDGEIPGSAIRCRCVADVVEDEVLNL